MKLQKFLKKLDRPKSVVRFEKLEILYCLWFLCSEIYYVKYYPKIQLAIRMFDIENPSLILGLVVIITYFIVSLYILFMITFLKNKIAYFFSIGTALYGIVIYWKYLFVLDVSVLLLSVFNISVFVLGLFYLLTPSFIEWMYKKNSSI